MIGSGKTSRLMGLGAFPKKSRFNIEKYKDLINVDFNITDRCCYIMKKSPSKKYKGKAIIGTTAEESALRTQAWLKTGCNAFDSGKSKPISFWTEQDILKYIKDNNIEICSVYGEIVECGDKDNNQITFDGCGQLKCTECQSTGCIFCGFGAHLDKKDGNETRFERLKRTHPKQYDYCMGGGEYNEQGIWQPSKQGLGMAHCIDELNKIYGKDFIKY